MRNFEQLYGVWIDGYEHLYSITKEGVVWSHHPRYKERRRLKAGRDSTGRFTVSLVKGGSRRTHRVYVLLLAAFVGPRPPGMWCCHNNGDCTDDRLENLRYDTPKGNMQDKILHGTDCRGSKHVKSILTDSCVFAIRSLLAEGRKTQVEIAKAYGVDQSLIPRIKSREVWGWLV